MGLISSIVEEGRVLPGAFTGYNRFGVGVFLANIQANSGHAFNCLDLPVEVLFCVVRTHYDDCASY